MKPKFRYACFLGMLSGFATLCGPARAADYPNEPIQLVVGFAPGGSGDLVARLVASALTNTLSEPVIVENKPGAHTAIAANYVAHARPDGYTLLLYTSALAYPIHTQVYFDPIKSFEPIMELAEQPSVLVVSSTLPVKRFQDLVTLAKSEPHQLRYATTGPQTPNYTMTQVVLNRVGADIFGIPYTGESPMTVSVLGNETQLAFMSYSASAPQIGAGKFRALAVTTEAPSPQLPGIPTIAVLTNDPGFDISFWYGIVAPAGTPPNVLKAIHDALAVVMKSQTMQASMAKNGLQIVAGTPDEFLTKLQHESAFWQANDK